MVISSRPFVRSGNIWLRSERPAYGPKPVYSRAEITEAAIRIADAEGLEAATMRRIAAGIAAGAMSLYRYVPSRDNLIELMADRVMGEIDVPRNSGRNIGEIAMRGIFVEVTEPRLRGSHPASLGPGPGQPDRGQVWALGAGLSVSSHRSP